MAGDTTTIYDSISQPILKTIYDDLRQNNRYALELKEIGASADRLLQDAARANELPQVRHLLLSQASYLEVASIRSDTERRNRTLRIQLREGHQQEIPMTSHHMEPLSYPLLFTKGEHGWGANISKHVKIYQYLASRILCPDRLYNGEMMRIANSHGDLVPCSRFQAAARLMSYYAVDMVSRAVDQRMDWQRGNQATMFGGTTNYEAYQREVDEYNDRRRDRAGLEQLPAEHTQPVFLSSTVHGSPRHLRDLSVKGLSLVSEMGIQTLFITMTTNINWPEIQEMLLPGQTAFDRPDVVVRVFHARLEKLLQNLKEGKYFGRHLVDYILRCIEYQERGKSIISYAYLFFINDHF